MVQNRILFINPPQSCHIKEKQSNLKFPLGFLYMAGHLEKHGFKVKILDCPLYYKKRRVIDSQTAKIGSYPSEIKQVIKDFNPDIIGVSCAFTAFESDSFEVIDLIRNIEKEMNKRFLIVVGGAHTSANAEYVLRNEKIDLAVQGEGEETILEIAENYKSGKSLKNIKGTSLRINGKFKSNPVRPYIENLDILEPAWHLLDFNLYFSHPDNSMATMRSPSVDIITSRGCPGNCVFCSIHTVWGRKWRGMSAEAVVKEIELLVSKYGIKQFRFQDDNLTLDNKRIIKICDEIIKRKLDIRWDTPNGVAFWTLNEEIIRKMRKAGCYRITFGIESACPETQKYIRKNVDINKISKIIDTCHKVGMWVCSTFILGFPFENKESIEQTRKFIISSSINFPFIYIAQPWQGTDMYEDFKKEKLIKNFKQTSSVAFSRYDTHFFTSFQLNKIRNKIYREFYIRKTLSYANPFKFYKEFLSKIRNFEDFNYSLKSFFNIAALLRMFV